MSIHNGKLSNSVFMAFPARYRADGTGRDGYCINQNTIQMDPPKYVPITFAKKNYKKAAAHQSQERVPMRLADGTGRDSYIVLTNGGFTNPSYVPYNYSSQLRNYSIIAKPRFGKTTKEYEDHQHWYRKEQKQAIINRRKTASRVTCRLTKQNERDASISSDDMSQVRLNFYHKMAEQQSNQQYKSSSRSPDQVLISRAQTPLLKPDTSCLLDTKNQKMTMEQKRVFRKLKQGQAKVISQTDYSSKLNLLKHLRRQKKHSNRINFTEINESMETQGDQKDKSQTSARKPDSPKLHWSKQFVTDNAYGTFSAKETPFLTQNVSLADFSVDSPAKPLVPLTDQNRAQKRKDLLKKFITKRRLDNSVEPQEPATTVPTARLHTTFQMPRKSDLNNENRQSQCLIKKHEFEAQLSERAKSTLNRDHSAMSKNIKRAQTPGQVGYSAKWWKKQNGVTTAVLDTLQKQKDEPRYQESPYTNCLKQRPNVFKHRSASMMSFDTLHSKMSDQVKKALIKSSSKRTNLHSSTSNGTVLGINQDEIDNVRVGVSGRCLK